MTAKSESSLLLNAQVVNEVKIENQDLFVKYDWIEQIGADFRG